MNSNLYPSKDLLQAVTEIKSAILYCQHHVSQSANKELLSLYYGIGKYVSEHTRTNAWGTNAIETISAQLRKELPGLRGFSASAIKRMRTFYEEWCEVINRPSTMADLYEGNSSIETQTLTIRPLMMGEINASYFLSISFTHHSEIIAKTKSLEERLFYIRQTAINHWNIDRLVGELKADLYHHQAQMPNNFVQTMPKNALRAIEMFKDNYLLDFVNVEELGAREAMDVDERVVELIIAV